MRIRACAAFVLCVLLAGCGQGVSLPQPDPPAPTPIAAATHPPALGQALRPTPVATSPSVPPPSVPTSVTLARPQGGALVYVAIGASETVGVGANDPPHDGWVPELARLLGPDTRLSNLGVSGTLLSTALKDQLPLAVQAQPDLVTVWLAVDDLYARVSLESYSADLETLLASLTRQTSARILVGSVPDLAQVPAFKVVDPILLRAEVGRWNAAITQVAGRHGAVVVDLYAGYAELGRHPEYISGDGFHPSTAGYARVGEMFYEAARPALPALVKNSS